MISYRSWYCSQAASVCVLLFFSCVANARTFNFDTEHFATYVRGTYGPSSLGDSAFANSSGVGASTDRKVRSNFSGEVGFLLPYKTFNLRLSAEYLFPYHYSDIKGADSSGTTLYNLDSKVTAIIPMLNIEYLLRKSATSHFLIGAGGGLAFVSLDNEYTMQPAGTTAFPGVGDNKESATATALALQAYTGYEFLLSDSATLALDLGYRFCYVGSLKSTKDTTTFTGSETSGSDLKNSDGSNRTLNLGGPFVGLSLRFYLGS
jgi:hypothetical protein